MKETGLYGAACLVILVIWTVFGAFFSWLGMLAFNFIAKNQGWNEIGFWTAFAAYVLLSIIGSFFRNSK